MTTKYEVLDLHTKNPQLSCAEVAKMLDCTTAYVRKVESREGIRFRRTRQNTGALGAAITDMLHTVGYGQGELKLSLTSDGRVRCVLTQTVAAMVEIAATPQQGIKSLHARLMERVTHAGGNIERHGAGQPVEGRDG